MSSCCRSLRSALATSGLLGILSVATAAPPPPAPSTAFQQHYEAAVRLFLSEHYPEARKSCWDIKGIYATSRHVPGVRYPGLVHPGLIGCLPDPQMLATWNTREQALIWLLQLEHATRP